MKIMATNFGYKREAVRVKAIKIDGNCMPETRKFSVDPQITTFDVLRSILSKAFDIKPDFTVFYRVLDDYNQETYLPLLSDWDLDAAFVSAADPCLCLRIDMKIYEEVGEEWSAGSNSLSWITESKIPLRLQGMIMNHVEKTLSMFRGALNFIEDIQQAQEATNQPVFAPLTDADFREYLNSVGQLVKVNEFKNTIYFGGVDPSFRKVIWKHLLNVYPKGLSGKERMEYMKRKSHEYEQLKNAWKNATNDEQMKEELSFVTSMVKKDVLRTDRQHSFYAGKDDNQNIVSLFNILTTYALNHPSVSYCQGMSDLASPLLVTMGNEAHAYICFCSLMRRLAPNFLIDGVTMTQRFQHLADGLLYYDPTFYAYLKARQADDLLFCYRWLLLEMKREFAFDDALRMLEVMWSSLPPSDPSCELPLYEVRFCSDSQFPPPPSPSPRETPYTKVCALRRQTSSGKALMINRSLDESVIAKRRLHNSTFNKAKKFSSLDDAAFLGNRYTSKSSLASSLAPSPGCVSGSVFNYNSNTTAVSNNNEKKRLLLEVVGKSSTEKDLSTKANLAANKKVKNFNEFLTLEKKIAKKKAFKEGDSGSGEIPSDSSPSPDDSSEYYPMTTSITQKLSKDLENLEKQVFNVRIENTDKDNEVESKNIGDEVFVWENPLQDDATQELSASSATSTDSNVDSSSTSDDVAVEPSSCNGKHLSEEFEFGSSFKSKDKVILPGPTEFGGGNPFLMFLCISVLTQHRDMIMKSNYDYNEIAMHFDKMVRKHNVNRVLNQARLMYAAYLKHHRQNYLKV